MSGSETGRLRNGQAGPACRHFPHVPRAVEPDQWVPHDRVPGGCAHTGSLGRAVDRLRWAGRWFGPNPQFILSPFFLPPPLTITYKGSYSYTYITIISFLYLFLILTSPLSNILNKTIN